MIPRWATGARYAAAMTLMVLSGPGHAEQAGFFLAAGTEIPLVTAEPLSSRTNVKGNLVALATAQDILVDGHVVIPRGTSATGQVTDAQAKGALGMSGRLAIRPLYLRLGDTYLRMGGAVGNKGSVTAGAVVGMALITPGFTGRSAVIAKGTALTGYLDHGATLPGQ